jgi:hypothetical protein
MPIMARNLIIAAHLSKLGRMLLVSYSLDILSTVRCSSLLRIAIWIDRDS